MKLWIRSKQQINRILQNFVYCLHLLKVMYIQYGLYRNIIRLRQNQTNYNFRYVDGSALLA